MPADVRDNVERENGHAGLAAMTGRLPLMGGGYLRERPIQPDDVERLREFHRRLSTDAVMYRFFRYMPELSEREAMHFTHLDLEDRMALVATDGSGPEERIVGVVRYERLTHDTAEVAFVVEDHWQGHGIATALLHRLARYARLRGVTRFVAVTMGSNVAMLEVFRHAGYPLSMRFDSAEYVVELDIHASVPFEERSLTE
jgi:RimJ/RimL family protein N-acetyltransferase